MALPALCLLATGCASSPTHSADLARHEYVQISMGVPVRLVVYAPSEQAAFDACKAAYARIAQLNTVASDYIGDSELMRLCRSAGQGPVKVSDDLFVLLERSNRISWESGGAFDCTVGPLVKLWREARKSGELPPEQDITAAKQLVGWQNIKLDPLQRTAELMQPGMQLDMGGIGKGYAGDCALETLRQCGLTRAFFEAGGEIVLTDAPPGAEGWRIEITGGKGEPDRVEYLANCAVSTSGDTEQFVIINGIRYSHVVDPRIGLGLTNRVMTTVITRYGIDADALSTACDMVTPEQAKALVALYPGARVIQRVPKDPPMP